VNLKKSAGGFLWTIVDIVIYAALLSGVITITVYAAYEYGASPEMTAGILAGYLAGVVSGYFIWHSS